MLILIVIIIRKQSWIGPTFANNVPATRVAGAVVRAAERGEKCLSSSSLCPTAHLSGSLMILRVYFAMLGQ